MEYLLPNISCRSHVSEPVNLYEIDLVKQWLNIFPGTVIETENFGKIIIINAGKLNKHEGPDIKDAILIINDKVVRGPIECHICTSDWYKHRHQYNSAYESVILHVVRKLNSGIITPKIPTIILNPGKINLNECSLNNFNKSEHLFDTILHYSHSRWIDKINTYNGYHDNPNRLTKLLIINSFRILGAGGNEKQFELLANNINLLKIREFNLQEIEKYLRKIDKELGINWVKRGIRPAQQPQNRMKLAAELIQYYYNLNIDKLPNLKDIYVSLTAVCPSAAGKGIQTELLGNILIPLYAARALYFNKIEDYHNYYEIWNYLKLPNAYRKFAKRFGTILQSTQLKSFSILQGLIAIDKNWCSKNLCHLCPLKEKNYVNSK